MSHQLVWSIFYWLQHSWGSCPAEFWTRHLETWASSTPASGCHQFHTPHVPPEILLVTAGMLISSTILLVPSLINISFTDLGKNLRWWTLQNTSSFPMLTAYADSQDHYWGFISNMFTNSSSCHIFWQELSLLHMVIHQSSQYTNSSYSNSWIAAVCQYFSQSSYFSSNSPFNNFFCSTSKLALTLATPSSW